jgi:hypothetical protein
VNGSGYVDGWNDATVKRNISKSILIGAHAESAAWQAVRRRRKAQNR